MTSARLLRQSSVDSIDDLADLLIEESMERTESIEALAVGLASASVALEEGLFARRAEH